MLKRFFGMASWYRKFVCNFVTIAEPLMKLSSTRGGFKWDMEKKILLLPALALVARPDFTKQFTIQTDASYTGIGGCLTQDSDGQERVIEYFSRVLNLAQRNYKVT